MIRVARTGICYYSKYAAQKARGLVNSGRTPPVACSVGSSDYCHTSKAQHPAIYRLRGCELRLGKARE